MNLSNSHDLISGLCLSCLALRGRRGSNSPPTHRRSHYLCNGSHDKQCTPAKRKESRWEVRRLTHRLLSPKTTTPSCYKTEFVKWNLWCCLLSCSIYDEFILLHSSVKSPASSMYQQGTPIYRVLMGFPAWFICPPTKVADSYRPYDCFTYLSDICKCEQSYDCIIESELTYCSDAALLLLTS